MNDEKLLRRLKDNRKDALEQTIKRYGGYVYAIIRNRSAGLLPSEDVEELTSDVFVTLWQHAGEIREERLRPWLGSVARNRVTDALRRQRVELPLDEDLPEIEDELWQRLAVEERAALVRAALNQLNKLDRELFYRTYDLCQSSAQIEKELGIPAATVRTRLARGRKTLRAYLQKGGLLDETDL